MLEHHRRGRDRIASGRRQRRHESTAETVGLLAVTGGVGTISAMLTCDAVPWSVGAITALACVTVGFIAFHVSDMIRSRS